MWVEDEMVFSTSWETFFKLPSNSKLKIFVLKLCGFSFPFAFENVYQQFVIKKEHYWSAPSMLYFSQKNFTNLTVFWRYLKIIWKILVKKGTRKTLTRKVPTWIIRPGQFPHRKPPPKKIPTQDNSHLENFHLKNSHPG